MKFSVLLPTRNRLDLLKLAVQSVRQQAWTELEIVISDNNSTEPVKEYVEALDDPAIVYDRLDTSVSVTENWNNALSRSTGDYVIMLGDDDALTAGYCARIADLIDAHDFPDCLYTGSFMFTYPGVIPDADYGVVHANMNAIFFRGNAPYFLQRDARLALVNDSMRLFSSFGFNMQFATVSRKSIDFLGSSGPFYQTQYPDYFAMNNLFLKVDRLLVVEEPLVSIGVSNSSFGWYYHNQREAAGNELLKIREDMNDASFSIRDHLLPGTSMNTNWLTSMIGVYHANADRDGLIRPDVGRYRQKQIIYCRLLQAHGNLSREDRVTLRRSLRLRERIVYLLLWPLTVTGVVGSSLLGFLHKASQKRLPYLLRLLGQRIRGRPRVVKFSGDHSILDAEALVDGCRPD